MPLLFAMIADLRKHWAQSGEHADYVGANPGDKGYSTTIGQYTILSPPNLHPVDGNFDIKFSCHCGIHC